MKIRRLDIGADGKAEVELLTSPIPRHLSLVTWGANDAPAVSWKAADPTAASLVLRSPPSGKVTDATQVDAQTLRGFVAETVDCWMSVCDGIMATPMQPADRAAQVRAVTVQAGARIAAAIKILGNAAATAAAAHRSAALKAPELPNSSTLQGEIDRRVLRSAMEGAAAFMLDSVLEIARNATDGRGTESVLALFSAIADDFAGAMMAMPAGVVGVAQKAVATPTAYDIIDASSDDGEWGEFETQFAVRTTDQFYSWYVKREVPLYTYRYDVIDKASGQVVQEGEPEKAPAPWVHDGVFKPPSDAKAELAATQTQKANDLSVDKTRAGRGGVVIDVDFEEMGQKRFKPGMAEQFAHRAWHGLMTSKTDDVITALALAVAGAVWLGGVTAGYTAKRIAAAHRAKVASMRAVHGAHKLLPTDHPAPEVASGGGGGAASSSPAHVRNPNFNPGYNFHRGKGAKATKKSAMDTAGMTIRVSSAPAGKHDFEVMKNGKPVMASLDSVSILSEVVDSSGAVIWATKPMFAPAKDSDQLLVPRAVQVYAYATALAQDCDGYIDYLASPDYATPSELSMDLKALRDIAAADPVGFLETIRSAMDAAKAMPNGVNVAKKFAWGETGVDPYDPNMILQGLVGFQGGDALALAIANAVAGVDVAKATGTGVTVAATMKSGLAKFVAKEITDSPTGELAVAIKSLVAPDVASAIVETFRRANDGGHTAMAFEPAKDEDIDLTPDMPSGKR